MISHAVVKPCLNTLFSIVGGTKTGKAVGIDGGLADVTTFEDREPHKQRRDRRSLRNGLIASIGKQDHPVLNYAVGGILIGNCRLPVMIGQRVFVTLFDERNRKYRVFAYGIVVRIDRFTHEVAFDFETPSPETFTFLEGLQSRAISRPQRRVPPKKGVLGWLGSLTGSPRRRR
ncbi:MAG: hypothetical protein RIC54_16860 [Thalassobaculum sp.]